MKNSRLASLEREMELHLDTLSSEVTSNLIAKLDFQPITAILASSAQQESAQVRSQFLFFKKIFPIFFKDTRNYGALRAPPLLAPRGQCKFHVHTIRDQR